MFFLINHATHFSQFLQAILLLTMIKFSFQQSCLDESNDPCLEGNHYLLNQSTRSVAYNNLNEQYVDDITLITRWYRSISGAGADMPTSRIESGYCQAIAPMWLNDTLPSVEDGIVESTACTHFATDSPCAYSQDICVKNCSDYNVYYLVRPSAAYARYCFGTELQCPEGTGSETGFTPNCTENPLQSSDEGSNPSFILIVFLLAVAIGAFLFIVIAILVMTYKRSENSNNR